MARLMVPKDKTVDTGPPPLNISPCPVSYSSLRAAEKRKTLDEGIFPHTLVFIPPSPHGGGKTGLDSEK